MCSLPGALPVVRVAFGETPYDPTQFADRKTEGYFALKGFLQDGGRLPQDEELAAELAVVEATIVEQRERVAYRIVPKEQLRKTLGRSPDKADAAMLAVLPMPDFASRENVWELMREAVSRERSQFPWDDNDTGVSLLEMEF